MNPTERVRLGRTQVAVTRLGLGTAPLAGLFRSADDAQAAEAVERAYALGLRYFDTAPLYGYGLAEQRLGRALRGKPREGVVVSTKVGRLLRADAPPDLSQHHDGEPFFKGTPPVNPVFDFSYEGVMTSLEESLQRLHLDRVDILYIHDPDAHHQEALEGAYKALAQPRRAGTVGAIGVGMNAWKPLVRFAHEADFDCFMLAGRYTLLDQGALAGAPPAVPTAGHQHRRGGGLQQRHPGRSPHEGALQLCTGASGLGGARAPTGGCVPALGGTAQGSGRPVPLRASSRRHDRGRLLIGGRHPGG